MWRCAWNARRLRHDRQKGCAKPSRGGRHASLFCQRRANPQIPADLSGHEAIVYGRAEAATPGHFCKASTEVSVAVSGRVKVNAAEGVRAAVLADMGIAIASEWMFGPELENGSVQAVLTEWALPPIDLWAMYPTGRMASAKARAFVAFVEEILAR